MWHFILLSSFFILRMPLYTIYLTIQTEKPFPPSIQESWKLTVISKTRIGQLRYCKFSCGRSESRRTGSPDFYIWRPSKTCFSVSKTLANIGISTVPSSFFFFYTFGVIKDKKSQSNLAQVFLIVWIPLLKGFACCLMSRLKSLCLEEHLSLVFPSWSLTCLCPVPEGRTGLEIAE